MGNFVGTGVVFNVLELSNTTDVVTASCEDGSTVVEFDYSVDFTSLKVKL